MVSRPNLGRRPHHDVLRWKQADEGTQIARRPPIAREVRLLDDEQVAETWLRGGNKALELLEPVLDQDYLSEGLVVRSLWVFSSHHKEAPIWPNVVWDA